MVNYTGQSYGRGGGPSVQHLRESGDLYVSSFQGTGGSKIPDHSFILPEASGLPGASVNWRWLITALFASTDNSADPTTPFNGGVYDSGITHTSNVFDAATLCIFSAHREGPFFQCTPQPIKVSPGAGVKVDHIMAPGSTSKHYLTIHAQLIRDNS